MVLGAHGIYQKRSQASKKNMFEPQKNFQSWINNVGLLSIYQQFNRFDSCNPQKPFERFSQKWRVEHDKVWECYFLYITCSVQQTVFFWKVLSKWPSFIDGCMLIFRGGNLYIFPNSGQWKSGPYIRNAVLKNPFWVVRVCVFPPVPRRFRSQMFTWRGIFSQLSSWWNEMGTNTSHRFREVRKIIDSKVPAGDGICDRSLEGMLYSVVWQMPSKLDSHLAYHSFLMDLWWNFVGCALPRN